MIPDIHTTNSTHKKLSQVDTRSPLTKISENLLSLKHMKSSLTGKSKRKHNKSTSSGCKSQYSKGVVSHSHSIDFTNFSKDKSSTKCLLYRKANL